MKVILNIKYQIDSILNILLLFLNSILIYKNYYIYILIYKNYYIYIYKIIICIVIDIKI